MKEVEGNFERSPENRGRSNALLEPRKGRAFCQSKSWVQVDSPRRPTGSRAAISQSHSGQQRAARTSRSRGARGHSRGGAQHYHTHGETRLTARTRSSAFHGHPSRAGKWGPIHICFNGDRVMESTVRSTALLASGSCQNAACRFAIQPVYSSPGRRPLGPQCLVKLRLPWPRPRLPGRRPRLPGRRPGPP